MHAHTDPLFSSDQSRAEILGATPVLEILLIEDDPDLSALIMEYLDMESMRCDNAMPARRAWSWRSTATASAMTASSWT